MPCPAVIEAGLAHFRERYATMGLFESESYPGAADMLATLRHAGHSPFVITSTPAHFSRQILEHFSHNVNFKEIYGPKLDGTHDDKSDLITRTTSDPLVKANEALDDLRAGRFEGAAVLVP